MKAEIIAPPFNRVLLTLETQEQVDAIFTLLNHTYVRESVGLSAEDYKILIPYKSSGANALHKALNALLK